jgi:hypothetical protein
MSGVDSMGIIPATEVPATDEVIDAIADIEMQRRETEKKAGFATSCSAALQRLNELLEHESKALVLRGPDAGHSGNVAALKLEIGRVKALAAPRVQDSIPRYVRTEQRQASWRNTPRNPARNKGRRTMGRASGR